jgi:hypothetical protein
MIAALLLRAKDWALTALSVLLVVLGAYALGGRRAKKAEQAHSEADRVKRDLALEKANSEAKDQIIQATETRNKVEAEVEALPPGGAQQQLKDEWSRD